MEGVQIQSELVNLYQFEKRMGHMVGRGAETAPLQLDILQTFFDLVLGRAGIPIPQECI